MVSTQAPPSLLRSNRSQATPSSLLVRQRPSQGSIHTRLIHKPRNGEGLSMCQQLLSKDKLSIQQERKPHSVKYREVHQHSYQLQVAGPKQHKLRARLERWQVRADLHSQVGPRLRLKSSIGSSWLPAILLIRRYNESREGVRSTSLGTLSVMVNQISTHKECWSNLLPCSTCCSVL